MVQKKYRLLTLLMCLTLGACGAPSAEQPWEGEGLPKEEASVVVFEDCEKTGSRELSYAKQFQIDYYGDLWTLIHIEEVGDYFLVEEGAALPEGIPDTITVLQKPIDNAYLVSTSAGDLILKAKALEKIRFAGTPAGNWALEEINECLDKEEILYAGKYNAPDYELLLEESCGLAIENTMIYHTPEVIEQLQSFQIPVLVERSSYETHPLGRLEWIKLYGELFSERETVEQFWQEQMSQLMPIMEQEKTGKTVAFFSVTANGTVQVRKTKDYVPKLIELAGGEYIFDSLAGEDENALGSMKLQMEEFYAVGKEADVLIYNSTIQGEIEDLSALLEKNSLLADFKAVKDGKVYCATQDFFQKPTQMGDFLKDINKVLTGQPKDEELTFLYRLR